MSLPFLGEFSKLSIGCNRLIKVGAKPVLSIDYILETYTFSLEKTIKFNPRFE